MLATITVPVMRDEIYGGYWMPYPVMHVMDDLGTCFTYNFVTLKEARDFCEDGWGASDWKRTAAGEYQARIPLDKAMLRVRGWMA